MKSELTTVDYDVSKYENKISPTPAISKKYYLEITDVDKTAINVLKSDCYQSAPNVAQSVLVEVQEYTVSEESCSSYEELE